MRSRIAADGSSWRTVARFFWMKVGELPYDLQSKLLRVLQEGAFERGGGDQIRKVDVRVVAAPNAIGKPLP